MRELEGYRKAMECLPSQIAEAQVQADRTEIISIAIMNGEQTGAQCSDVTELFIRVLVETEEGKKEGFYYTQNLEEEPKEVLSQAALHAYLAKDVSKERFLSFEESHMRLEGKETKDGESWDKIKKRALELERELNRENKNAQIMIRLIQTKETRGMVNSVSDARCIESSLFRYEAEMEIAEEEFNVPYFYGCSQSSERLEDLSHDFFQKKIEKWRGMRLKQGKLEAGEYPVVLDCEVTANLFATAWQMFTGKNYLSGSTPYAGKKGKAVMSSVLCIKNMPSVPEGGYRYGVDCEGVPVRPLILSENGILKNLLHTIATADAMKEEPTGTAGRKALLSGNIHTEIIPVPANFRIEKGERSTEDLLKTMGDGIYIFESFDVFHSINIASGEFHVPCKGIIVKNGVKEAVVEGITINGTIQDLLMNVEEVGREIQVRPMDLLKSYTVCTPALRITALKVTGSQS